MVQARTRLGLHGDKPDGHAFVWQGAAHNSAGANLAFRGLEKQLDIAALRERFFDADEEAAKSEIVDAGDESAAGRGPGDERAPRRSEARVAA